MHGDQATSLPTALRSGSLAAGVRCIVWLPVNRSEHLRRLADESFDVLVIGGGATGCGCALDAATRGLRVALVERGDFGGGTSSRSTKLVHGGVRYLEQAIKNMDRTQFRLVREALRERKALMELAPHLVRELAIFVPLYQRSHLPYYRIGLTLYDRLAGEYALRRSEFIPREEAISRFPHLRERFVGQARPRQISGGVVYYDGQFDDARMNLALALTAAEQGAAVSNYVEAERLCKSRSGRVTAVAVRDRLSGAAWQIRARVVINAGGPFVDAIRRLDAAEGPPLLRVSAGSHVVLGSRFLAGETGLLIPRTEDGRVIFVLPWQGSTLAGTTEVAAEVSADPVPGAEELAYLVSHLRSYLNLQVRPGDVTAAWSGLRPLIVAPTRRVAAGRGRNRGTATLTRDYLVELSDSGLLTVAGGKWTTYRAMAVQAVNLAVEAADLAPERASQTRHTPLAGGDAYQPDPGRLQRDYGFAADTALHLDSAFGTGAGEVAALAVGGTGLGGRLAPRHPYLDAEVVHAARHEAACTVDDVVSRRTRLAFLDSDAALDAVPRVAALLAGELGWSETEEREQVRTATARLEDQRRTARAALAME